MEKELDAELRFHFESQVADKMKAARARPKRAVRLGSSSVASIRSRKIAARAAARSG